MHSSISIRLKIVVVSRLCLLAMISLTTGMNLYQSSAGNRLTGSESRKMLTISAQAQLQAKAAEQALVLQKSFHSSLQLMQSLVDQANDLRIMVKNRDLGAGVLREELDRQLKTAFEHNYDSSYCRTCDSSGPASRRSERGNGQRRDWKSAH
ncbi:hypothetical protein IV505_20030 [Pseudomonas fulva]|nr:hypothetical protein [Pseudomonas fulva]MBF8781996.1 hypothetical protein [Pseudomonas fulva]